MTSRRLLERQRDLLLAKKKVLKARSSFFEFLKYMYPEYTFKPFHERICSCIQGFLHGDYHKVMIFVPPQHGKSTISSIAFPAYAFGLNPDLKIAVTSYAKTLASKFNRGTQMLMETKKYNAVFPETLLNDQNVSTDISRGALK